MAPHKDTRSCPCQSGALYTSCCGPYHLGKALPGTPEALMRSRFSAYCVKNTEHLAKTWAPSTRPATLKLTDDVNWCGLEIIRADPVNKASARSNVHFKATYRQGNTWHFLEEISNFERIEDRWFYKDGTVKEGLLKIKRNTPCPCGSGKKYKVCCAENS